MEALNHRNDFFFTPWTARGEEKQFSLPRPFPRGGKDTEKREKNTKNYPNFPSSMHSHKLNAARAQQIAVPFRREGSRGTESADADIHLGAEFLGQLWIFMACFSADAAATPPPVCVVVSASLLNGTAEFFNFIFSLASLSIS